MKMKTVIKTKRRRGVLVTRGIAKRKATLAKKKKNPSGATVVIYRRVLRIEAQKLGPHRCDAECRSTNHCYYHDFSKGAHAIAYGLSDGSVLIKGAKRLWGMF